MTLFQIFDYISKKVTKSFGHRIDWALPGLRIQIRIISRIRIRLYWIQPQFQTEIIMKLCLINSFVFLRWLNFEIIYKQPNQFCDTNAYSAKIILYYLWYSGISFSNQKREKKREKMLGEPESDPAYPCLALHGWRRPGRVGRHSWHQRTKARNFSECPFLYLARIYCLIIMYQHFLNLFGSGWFLDPYFKVLWFFSQGHQNVLKGLEFFWYGLPKGILSKGHKPRSLKV